MSLVTCDRSLLTCSVATVYHDIYQHSEGSVFDRLLKLLHARKEIPSKLDMGGGYRDSL